MDKHGAHHGSCCTPTHGCGCGSHGFRRFYTKEEKREHLERYAEQLKKELAAVEEHLNP
jgi:coproporphyrinogen III oxidase-like Fe-S oxidoreductase